jgi:hypothetical protein
MIVYNVDKKTYHKYGDIINDYRELKKRVRDKKMFIDKHKFEDEE